jgi:hypothetical protein
MLDSLECYKQSSKENSAGGSEDNSAERNMNSKGYTKFPMEMGTLEN